MNKGIFKVLIAGLAAASVFNVAVLAADAVTTVSKTDSEYVFNTQLSDNKADKSISIVIMYSKDKKLIDLSVADINGDKSENRITVHSDDAFAQVYIWSGFDDIKPVVDSVQTIDLSTEVIKSENSLSINGKLYSIGMSADALPEYDDNFMSISGYPWYVFGTDDYSGFFAACVADGKVVRILSAGKSFDYCGTRCGSQKGTYNSDYGLNIYTDKNDNNIVHAVELYDKNFAKTDVSKDTLAGESKMNFYLTNAFRVYHGKSPLVWSSAAAEAARLHSEDMASQNYFEHNSLDGTTMSERMEKQGISWWRCGENISAGRNTGAGSYNGWVNSSGHRENMLNEFDALGVGAGYGADSTYKFYFTQDFYSGR